MANEWRAVDVMVSVGSNMFYWLEVCGDVERYGSGEDPWKLAEQGIPEGERGYVTISLESIRRYYGPVVHRWSPGRSCV
jgi:hypothetical protein